jgi:hypothetical protein
VLLSFSAAGAPLNIRNARGRTPRDEAAAVLAAAAAAADAARRAGATAAAAAAARARPEAHGRQRATESAHFGSGAARERARESLWDDVADEDDGGGAGSYYAQWEGVTADLYEEAERAAEAAQAAHAKRAFAWAHTCVAAWARACACVRACV